MASSVSRRSCVISNDCKQTGVAHCEGCSQAFCAKHFNDHRRSLDEQMNIISSDYNDLMNAFNEESTNSDLDSLYQEIDNWEKESIEKIQEKGKELRQELVKFKTTQLENLSTLIQPLGKQLEKSREQDDFIETDFQRWKEQLQTLKSSLFSPSMIYMDRFDNTSLPNKSISFSLLSSGSDIFNRTFDNYITIQEEGKVVVGTGFLMAYNEIRGKNDYATGSHQVHLRIEHPSYHWTFLGINSKSTPLQKSSYSSKSTYGWCSDNNIYSGGTYKKNLSNSVIQMNPNDIISLFFDCDNRRICMINETTYRKHELIVDINYCPFPWQLQVILRQKNSRIRILSSK